MQVAAICFVVIGDTDGCAGATGLQPRKQMVIDSYRSRNDFGVRTVTPGIVKGPDMGTFIDAANWLEMDGYTR